MEKGVYLRQAREEPCLLVLVDPFQILQELDWATQRVEQVNDRGTMAFVAFRLELVSDVSLQRPSSIATNGKATYLVSCNSLKAIRVGQITFENIATSVRTACTHCDVLLSVLINHCRT